MIAETHAGSVGGTSGGGATGLTSELNESKSNVHVDHEVLHTEISPKHHRGRQETKFPEQKREHGSFQGYTTTVQHEYLSRGAEKLRIKQEEHK